MNQWKKNQKTSFQNKISIYEKNGENKKKFNERKMIDKI